MKLSKVHHARGGKGSSMARETDHFMNFPATGESFSPPCASTEPYEPVGIVDVRTVYVFVQYLVKWVVLFNVKCSGQQGLREEKWKKVPVGDD